MPTRAQLEKAAAKADRDHRKWLDRAELAEKTRVVCQSHAEALAAYRDDLLRRAAELDTKQDLHTRSQPARLNDVNDKARLNMSRANSSDPFVKACRAKDLTQNDVAKRIGVPRSLLSMYRAGVRRIPQDRAEAIEALTGWKADDKHWPGKILQGD